MNSLESSPTPPPLSAEGGTPANERLSSVLRRSLRGLLEGDGDLPHTARDGSAAALIYLPADTFPGGVSAEGARAAAPEAECPAPATVHYRGEQQFFPGDLVSLYFLAGTYLRIHQGAFALDRHVERDLLKMIRAGDADAANLLFDRITGTLSGPELEEANLAMFARRRGKLDESLRAIGIQGTRCEQKIWERSPYGRDAQLLGADGARENRITALATAAVLLQMLLGRIGTGELTAKMLDLLRIHLDRGDASDGPRGRLRLAADLPAGTRAWGRRTSGPRLLHEALVAELPSGQAYVLVILSHLGSRYENELVPLGRKVAEGILGLEAR